MGRALLQDIREFSAGHNQVDDITLICFGAAASLNRQPTMPIKVANIRLELDEPEEGLPEKIASRLGLPRDAIVNWRILRKSLDARGHDDIHFTYAAAVDLPEEDLERVGASAADSRPTFRNVSTGRSRARRPLRTGPSSSAPARPASSPAICSRRTGIGPLILERGRAVKDRVADVRRFDRAGPARPREQLPLRRGGRRHLQRRQAHLARHRAPT